MAETFWASARSIAGAAIGPGPVEVCALESSVGRTVARDVHAAVDLPSFPTAAMDGWAVRGPGPWRVVGTIDAGRPTDQVLADGQAMRIATGAVVPGDDLVVIPWEQTAVDDGWVHGAVPSKVHIRPVGEECRAGDVLARAGDQINPALLGALAAAGVDQVSVVQRTRIAVLILGDEVVTAGLPNLGQVRDALGVQLPGWIDALGGVVVASTCVPDDLGELVDALGAAVGGADIVIATGGTSRGHRDFLRAALDSVNCEWLVDGVHVRPGHPMMLAQVREVPVVGLPGNPLSALVALVTLTAPMMDSWFGRGSRPLAQVQMGQGVPAARRQLTRLMVGRRELGGFVEVDHVSSAMLRGISRADGWAVIPPEGVAEGEVVEWLPVPWMSRVSVDS